MIDEGGNTIKCRRQGLTVTVVASMTAKDLPQKWMDIAVLPSEMRPNFDIYFPAIPQSGTTPIKCEIAADGHVWAAPHGGTATGFLFVVSYLV